MSKVYNEIVIKNRNNTQKDIRYFIAYSIYKQHKKEFIENYQEKHNGIEPPQKILEEFQETILTKTALNNLYSKSDEIILNYGHTVFRNKLDQFNRIHSQISRTSIYFSGVSQSIVGSILFAVILFIIGGMIQYFKDGGLKSLLIQMLEN